MKDSRTVLDNVRARIPAGAKTLVAYIDNNGTLRLAQANCSQADINQMANTILVSVMRENLNG